MMNIPGISNIEVQEADGRIHMRLSATLQNIDEAVCMAHGFFLKAGYGYRLFGAKTALREALLNAVTHGCGLNPELFVWCSLEMDGSTAVMEVSDPGPGFDWRNSPPFSPGLESTTGRGLFIMNHYATALDYNEAGNTLKLRVELA